jgi:hypothetical protein
VQEDEPAIQENVAKVVKEGNENVDNNDEVKIGLESVSKFK